MAAKRQYAGVDISWPRGNERQYSFNIALSNDGTTFTTVFSGKSSGTTAAAENYRFADTQGRYVKITVNGNNVNDWANISEIDVFGPTDTTPPAITGTNPEDGSINVEVNSTITASFSEQLSSSSVTTDTFTLSKPGSTSDIAGTVSLSSDGKTASFQPSADLEKSTTYVATLSIGVKDLAGNQLSQAKSWTFTTISDFIPPPPPSNCVNNLPVTAVSASGSQSPNIPSNVIDNNIATRWSNEGLGSWIQLDLGSQKTICSVDISWYNGNQRVNTFTLLFQMTVPPSPRFSQVGAPVHLLLLKSMTLQTRKEGT